MSRPVRARELKRRLPRRLLKISASRPVRARELKPNRRAELFKYLKRRAPCGRVS